MQFNGIKYKLSEQLSDQQEFEDDCGRLQITEFIDLVGICCFSTQVAMVYRLSDKESDSTQEEVNEESSAHHLMPVLEADQSMRANEEAEGQSAIQNVALLEEL